MAFMCHGTQWVLGPWVKWQPAQASTVYCIFAVRLSKATTGVLKSRPGMG